MKLSRASTYALHAVDYLARHGGGGAVASHHIAAERGIPERFLLKVLKPLVSARVLESIKGPHGGYRLRKPADAVSLLDVVEAVDGPIRGNSPFAGKGTARMDARIGAVCDRSSEAVREHLKGVRISDLAADKTGRPRKGKKAGG
jgi:Rrf2 family protein